MLWAVSSTLVGKLSIMSRRRMVDWVQVFLVDLASQISIRRLNT